MAFSEEVQPSGSVSDSEVPVLDQGTDEAAGSEYRFKELLSWHAPLWPFKLRNREFYSTLAAILFLCSLIIFIAEGILPVLALWAAFFVYYAISTRAPEEVQYKITTGGIVALGDSYIWQEMESFWFDEKLGKRILKVKVGRSPWELSMILEGVSEEQAREVLLPYIPYREVVKKNFVDKASDYLSKKIFLEKE